MPSLTEAGAGDRELERYLLGLLPEKDAERLDQLSVVDDEVASRLSVVEDDLVDAYVSGELAGETLERFESFYLSSERRREKVRFARSFLGTDRGAGPANAGGGREAIRLPAAERDETPRGSRSRAPIVPISRAVWMLATAATLLLFAGGALQYQTVQLRNDLNEAQKTSAAISDRANDLQRQLNEQRAAIAETATAAAQPTASTTEVASRTLPAIALVLLPQTRAAGPIATLAVPRGLDRIALELRVDPNDFPRFQVSLTDPGTNQIVWSSDPLIARVVDDVPTVSVSIPTAVLKAQHYSLELDGLGSARSGDVVGSYAFQVVRR
jgi:hypothetical protein